MSQTANKTVELCHDRFLERVILEQFCQLLVLIRHQINALNQLLYRIEVVFNLLGERPSADVPVNLEGLFHSIFNDTWWFAFDLPSMRTVMCFEMKSCGLICPLEGHASRQFGEGSWGILDIRHVDTDIP